MRMRLSGDRHSQGRLHAVVPIGCRFAGQRRPRLGRAARFGREGRRPLLAHAKTGLQPLPGALCVTAGSQPEPEPSVLVAGVLSSPDLFANAACQSCSGASTIVENERWLKVK